MSKLPEIQIEIGCIDQLRDIFSDAIRSLSSDTVTRNSELKNYIARED